MRIMVTGANGFVGKHLVRQLSGKNDEIVAVLGPTGNSWPESMDTFLFAKVTADLTQKEVVRGLVQEYQPEQVYHLAGLAVTRGYSFDQYYNINVQSTMNMAESVLDVRGSKCDVLHVSSSAVYGGSSEVPYEETAPLRPSGDYALSKAFAELALWSSIARGLHAKIVRPFNHTGPFQGPGFVCPDMVLRIKQAMKLNAGTPEREVTIYNPEAVRDFTDVRDVVRAYELVMKEFRPGEVVNVASGIGTSVRRIAAILKNKVPTEGLPFREVNSADAGFIVGNSSLLMRRTGWKPAFRLEQTLEDLWDELLGE